MKFSFVSAVAALAVVAALAGCGGKAQFTVQGRFIDGQNNYVSLPNGGLILSNGNETITVPAGATSFSFPTKIDYGTDYNILVVKSADHMGCGVTGGSGSAGHNVSIQAVVQCIQNSYTISGNYTGVTVAADGKTARTVTLINGSTGGSVTISSANATNGAGTFVLSGAVYDGQAYGVTVVDPNNGLSCTLANGTGVMHEIAVTNLQLTCVPK
ncbi:hypothetical protein GTP45_23435 [Pseudoduganella sp. FT55W]|uniref:Lipoprotein n=1 Tax=Duganella rivi TaxID=2666083 RepID=A0A7X4KDU3_9BURK|nr:hypothetical protein [Duganella rivi]MYM69774.1 hypothetical protein [Duganella rivi]